MIRQRIPAERRTRLRRQALEAGVSWTKADEMEDDGETTTDELAEAAESAGELWGAMLDEDGRTM